MKKQDMMKADENAFSFFHNRNEALQMHISSFFITMAADKATTGFHYSAEMNSFMQKEKKPCCYLLSFSSTSLSSSLSSQSKYPMFFYIMQKKI